MYSIYPGTRHALLIVCLNCFCRLQTALHKAAWYGYRSICHTLVEAGASLTRLDYQNNAPYDKARQNGDKELSRYLKGENIYCIV